MSETRKESYLFGSLDKAYLEERRKFEEARSSQKNQELFQRARKIIGDYSKRSSDNMNIEPAGVVTGDTITVTAADIRYQGLIEPGESAFVQATDWIPCGQRVVNGNNLNFSVRFKSLDFIKVGNEDNEKRLGPVNIEGKLTDSDGVSGDFPLANLQENLQTHQFQLLWNFGNEIPFGSTDYSEVVKIIDSVESRLEI